VNPAGCCPAAHGRLHAQNTHLGIRDTDTELAPTARTERRYSRFGADPWNGLIEQDHG
jgi:hypothetical protein